MPRKLGFIYAAMALGVLDAPRGRAFLEPSHIVRVAATAVVLRLVQKCESNRRIALKLRSMTRA